MSQMDLHRQGIPLSLSRVLDDLQESRPYKFRFTNAYSLLLSLLIEASDDYDELTILMSLLNVSYSSVSLSASRSMKKSSEI